jgi:hypothetical protein
MGAFWEILGAFLESIDGRGQLGVSGSPIILPQSSSDIFLTITSEANFMYFFKVGTLIWRA